MNSTAPIQAAPIGTVRSYVAGAATAAARSVPVPGPAPAPAADEAARREAEQPAPEQLQRLAADLARLTPPTASVRFRVDPDVDRVVISVVDADTGDVLRQIPSEEALAIARSMADSGSGIVSDRA
jgi:flagellar protein FlaG